MRIDTHLPQVELITSNKDQDPYEIDVEITQRVSETNDRAIENGYSSGNCTTKRGCPHYTAQNCPIKTGSPLCR